MELKFQKDKELVLRKEITELKEVIEMRDVKRAELENRRVLFYRELGFEVKKCEKMINNMK